MKDFSMKLEIGNFVFDLMLVDKDNEHLESKDESTFNAGTTDFRELKIYIDKTLPNALIEATIIHEITHAYLYAYGFSSEIMNEEELCVFMGHNMRFIYQLYKRASNEIVKCKMDGFNIKFKEMRRGEDAACMR